VQEEAEVSTAAIPLELIDAGPNDRQTFQEEALRELAESIQTHGLAQPPTLRLVGDRYEIVAGERRVRAMRLLGWAEIPAFVREMDDETASAIMLAENVQRTDLDPLEEARAYASRRERFGYSVEDLARVANVSTKRVYQRLSLLHLEESIAHLVSRKALPLAYAYCLTQLDVNRQRLAIRAHQTGNLTLEQFRALTNKLYAQQQSEPMFDPASFMQVEEFVADACATVAANSTVDEVNDPVGTREIAELLKVKAPTVEMWRHRGLLPEPRWVISGTPIWEATEIEQWARATGRLKD
jgi:ParB family chromosome partitioning protein